MTSSNLEQKSMDFALGDNKLIDISDQIEIAIEYISQIDNFKTPWKSIISVHLPNATFNYSFIDFAKTYKIKKSYENALIDLFNLLDLKNPYIKQKVRRIIIDAIIFNIKIKLEEDTLTKEKIFNEIPEELVEILNLKRIMLDNSFSRQFLEVNFDGLLNKSYKMLIFQINDAFERKAYPIVELLLKKLFEELIIDIFKVAYGNKEEYIPYFFDLENGCYLELPILIKNLKKKVSEIKPLTNKFYIQNLEVLEFISKEWPSQISDFEIDPIKINLILKRLRENREEINSSIRIISRILISLKDNSK
ncbi:MAG: hypothetical protein ACTSRZ_07820 [Promethearchaeota archaeon]